MDDLLEFPWNARRELRAELLHRLFGPSSEAVGDATECLRLTDPGYGHPSARHDDSVPGSTTGAACEIAATANDVALRLSLVPSGREALERWAIRLCIYSHREEFRKVRAILQRRANLKLVYKGENP